MENKYFVPSIEELHVGYELEFHWKFDGDYWDPIVLQGVDIAVKEYLKQGLYRVPFLSMPQIEHSGWTKQYVHSGGWVLTKDFDGFGWWELYYEEKSINAISHTEECRHIKITRGRSKKEDVVRYEGECRDINTFRTICKLLNIK